MKYAFVEKNRRQYGVPALCEALQVSRSGYYAARHRGPSDRQKRRVDLTARIRTIHQASRESYGAPRVHVELLAQKVPCCRNTVAKLMRRAEILPKAIRRFRVTTDSRKTKASPNLINRDFTSEHPNDLWLSDITYIPTREGWLYLAAVLDAYSRALVGWAMSRTLDTKLAMDALNMAIAHRGPPVTLHSDQGSTYATGSYREIVNRYGIRQSMSRKVRQAHKPPWNNVGATAMRGAVSLYREPLASAPDCSLPQGLPEVPTSAAQQPAANGATARPSPSADCTPACASGIIPTPH